MAALEDHVTCAICMDLYNDPLALPCLHSFCRHCIQGLFSSSLTVKCPECRIDVNLGRKGVDELPRNFQLAGIVESYRRGGDESRRQSADESTRRPFCTHHKMTCEIMCSTCIKPVCIKCLTVERHQKKHKLKLIDKSRNEEESQHEIKCTFHDRVYKLFCSDCETLVCNECAVKSHGGHSFATIGDTYEYNVEILKGTVSELDARSRLLKATQNTCRLLAQKTQTDAQKKRQELVTYFSRLRDAVDKREASMKSELDRRENEIVQKYMTKADDVRRKEKLVSDLTDDVKRLVTENKAMLLKHYKSKATRIADLLTDEYTDSPPQQRGVDDVSLVTCSIEKELANISWRFPNEEFRPVRKAPPIPKERKKSSVSSKLKPPPTQTQPLIKVGTPVRRGKDWHDGIIDGGPGHIGTVTAVEVDSNLFASTICTVRWPNGKTGQYTYSPSSCEQISPV